MLVVQPTMHEMVSGLDVIIQMRTTMILEMGGI